MPEPPFELANLPGEFTPGRLSIRSGRLRLRASRAGGAYGRFRLISLSRELSLERGDPRLRLARAGSGGFSLGRRRRRRRRLLLRGGERGSERLDLRREVRLARDRVLGRVARLRQSQLEVRHRLAESSRLVSRGGDVPRFYLLRGGLRGETRRLLRLERALQGIRPLLARRELRVGRFVPPRDGLLPLLLQPSHLGALLLDFGAPGVGVVRPRGSLLRPRGRRRGGFLRRDGASLGGAHRGFGGFGFGPRDRDLLFGSRHRDLLSFFCDPAVDHRRAVQGDVRLIHEGVRLGLRHRGGLLHRRGSFLGGGGAGFRLGEAAPHILRLSPRAVSLLDHGALGLVRALPPLLEHRILLGDAGELRGERGGLAPELLAPGPLAATLALVFHVFPAEGPLTRDALAPDVDPGGERAEPFAARLALGAARLLVRARWLLLLLRRRRRLLRLLLLLLLRRPGGHARAPGCRPVVVGAEGNGGHAPVVVHSRRAGAGEEVVQIHCRRRRVTATALSARRGIVRRGRHPEVGEGVRRGIVPFPGARVGGPRPDGLRRRRREL